ncbi:MAG TPA: family 1 glycosylhydrolase, partial [Anaerolineaceae bacterium]
MPQATFYFPGGFLWGTATAAHQVEGNNTNNTWYAWEQEPGRIKDGQKSGLACDWWGGRWREDLDRAADAGQNTHRMSLEWSRIQPEPERWDEYALDHYREIVRGMVDRGMMPMITLHHFTDPLWLAEQGGWESAQTPGKFAAFARRVVEALQEYTNLWVTINEPNVYMYSGYVSAEFPPGKRSLDTAFRVAANLIRGHAEAYAAIHAQQRTARVGIAQNFRGFVPAHPNFPLDRLVAGIQHRIFNDSIPRALVNGTADFVRTRVRIPEAAHTLDFLGVNTYTRDHVAFSPFLPDQGFGRNFFPAGADLSGTGFISNEPEGMFEALRWAHRFGVPLMVTENGVDDADD